MPNEKALRYCLKNDSSFEYFKYIYYKLPLVKCAIPTFKVANLFQSFILQYYGRTFFLIMYLLYCCHSATLLYGDF